MSGHDSEISPQAAAHGALLGSTLSRYGRRSIHVMVEREPVDLGWWVTQIEGDPLDIVTVASADEQGLEHHLWVCWRPRGELIALDQEGVPPQGVIWSLETGDTIRAAAEQAMLYHQGLLGCPAGVVWLAQVPKGAPQMVDILGRMVTIRAAGWVPPKTLVVTA